MTLDGIFVSALANRKDESRFRIRYFVAVVLCFICVCYCFRGRGSKQNGLCSYCFEPLPVGQTMFSKVSSFKSCVRPMARGTRVPLSCTVSVVGCGLS